MLKFTNLTVENFGPYKGEQVINFTSENGVTIIWGNNGRGKTILLNAFRYALYGKVIGRGSKKHSLKDIGNLLSFDERDYGFKVSLKMDYNGTQYELIRQYTVNTGVKNPTSDTDYKEKVSLKRGVAILSEGERDHILTNIMPEQVSRFFLFDGELLQEYEELLSDENVIGMKIKESIERILGVPVLVNGHTDTNNVLREFQSKLTKAAQNHKKTQTIGVLLEAKQAELNAHEEQLVLAKTELDKLLKDKQMLEQELKLLDKYKSLIDKKNMLNDTKNAKEKSLAEKYDKMKDLTKQAWQGMLGSRIRELTSELDEDIKVLEDKKAKFILSQQIMEELKKGAESEICPICEQTLNDTVKKKIYERLQNDFASNINNSLTAEEEAYLISLQSRRSTIKKLNVKDTKELVLIIEEDITDLVIEINDLAEQLLAISQLLTGVNDSAVTSVYSNYHKCCQKILVTDKAIKDEEEIIKNTKYTIRDLEIKLKDISTNGVLEDIKKKKELCEKLKELFSKGIDQYRENLKNKVEVDSSLIFTKIANEPEYTGLKINENYGLSIVHESGRIIELRSSGYEHIVALSLIGALHKNAPLQGPVIIDSPFGRLDTEHKKKVTAALPILSEQVVLLVYVDEIKSQEARRTLGGELKREYELVRISGMNTEIKLVKGEVN